MVKLHVVNQTIQKDDVKNGIYLKVQQQIIRKTSFLSLFPQFVFVVVVHLLTHTPYTDFK